MLYADDDVDLCEAHIVNKAFGASSLSTVQRKDVDGFYGSVFESDFVDLKDRGRKSADVLADRALAKRFRPKIMAAGRPIDYYMPTGPIPPEHTRVILGGPHGDVAFVLKAPPDEVAALSSADWTVAVEKDVRIPALVSTLKAAHLTLFEMLGYTYALSAGGHFLGHDVLGKFFLENRGKAKSEVLARASLHFREFAHMMRPMLGVPDSFKGTAEEKAVYVCERGSIRWGMIVMVRTTPGPLHAVLVPVLEDPVAAPIFMNFLRGSTDEPFAARLAWFRGDRWEAATETVNAHWPKTGVLYPEMEATATTS
jgi:hypothetical protein